MHKLNFNGGDDAWPCAGTNTRYQGSLPDWPCYLAEFVNNHRIDAVFCYNDCREYHKAARQFCLARGLKLFVFEEGYLRPDYITLEQGGVNAHSPWYGQLASLLTCQAPVDEHLHFSVAPTFNKRIYYAVRYYLNMQLDTGRFSHYVHHRHRPCWREATAWLRGWFTKLHHKPHDRCQQQRLIDHHSGRIFLMPLQVADDFQIRSHSPFKNVAQAINQILDSFSAHSAANDVLLLKHHPMDRGYSDYSRQIKQRCTRLGINNRVFYGFEFSLPELYRHCKGVVTINSTVGISALLHKVPTLTLGKALYDLPGLTSQCGLDTFWQRPEPVNYQLFTQLRYFLLSNTQVNGSFYGQYRNTCEQIWQRLGESAQLENAAPKPALIETDIPETSLQQAS
ncbi:capsular biosynthesis protein [Zobellella maritima]|uniref:capsular biosynthesis protein n=1 Tax=Zobellella maritima TaxID=2059725 RepID=UPI0018E4EEB1|nr:capsular biosynthesis protein [Zobellella maritima]